MTGYSDFPHFSTKDLLFYSRVQPIQDPTVFCHVLSVSCSSVFHNLETFVENRSVILQNIIYLSLACWPVVRMRFALLGNDSREVKNPSQGIVSKGTWGQFILLLVTLTSSPGQRDVCQFSSLCSYLFWKRFFETTWIPCSCLKLLPTDFGTHRRICSDYYCGVIVLIFYLLSSSVKECCPLSTLCILVHLLLY